VSEQRAEIIAIGTELLLGQIANTNAQWLSSELSSRGINTLHHTVVGDNLSRVINVFKQAAERSNIIIVSGGLGPTEDDMTREAFQVLTELKMYEYEPAMQTIEQFYEAQDTPMPINNRRQARVFEGATVINNETGMAPGMIVEAIGSTWIFLPGVPREMKTMSLNSVFPYLLGQSAESMVIRSKVLKFIGIGESKLEEDLKDLIQAQTNPTIAPLAQDDGVIIRLTAKDTTEAEAFEKIESLQHSILERVGSYYYGADDDTIEGKVFQLLQQKKVRVASAESLTGGKFIERLISFPGASQISPGAVVCYDSQVKINTLNVRSETIKNDSAVSEACALEMASNVRDVLKADIGISFTGEAGPFTKEERPTGTVYIAIVTNSGYSFVEKFLFQGDRTMIRHRATLKGYELLFNYLKL